MKPAGASAAAGGDPLAMRPRIAGLPRCTAPPPLLPAESAGLRVGERPMVPATSLAAVAVAAAERLVGTAIAAE